MYLANYIRFLIPAKIDFKYLYHKGSAKIFNVTPELITLQFKGYDKLGRLVLTKEPQEGEYILAYLYKKTVKKNMSVVILPLSESGLAKELKKRRTTEAALLEQLGETQDEVIRYCLSSPLFTYDKTPEYLFFHGEINVSDNVMAFSHQLGFDFVV
jgi:hypothetical protein